MKFYLNSKWVLTNENPAPYNGRVFLVNMDDLTPYRADVQRFWEGRKPIKSAFDFALRLAVEHPITKEMLECLDAFEKNTTKL